MNKRGNRKIKIIGQKFDIAEGSFDLPTSGLWAQHGSAAPLCWENFTPPNNLSSLIIASFTGSPPQRLN